MDLWSVLFDISILLIVFLVIVSIYGKIKHSHFNGTGVKFISPPFPFTGNTFKMFAGIENLHDLLVKSYNRYPDEKYIGMFEGFTPLILIRDPKIIKSVGLKDFDTFHDHQFIIGEDMDIFGKTLLVLRGKNWRDMRATVSPAFSSSKMKNIFAFVEKCSQELSKHYMEKIQNDEIMEVELKDMFTKYTVDAIASTTFGIETNSLKENNTFLECAKEISHPSFVIALKFIGFALCPNLMKLFNIPFQPKRTSNFFSTILNKSIKERIEKNIVRQDIVQLLMQARNGALSHEKMVDGSSDTSVGFSTIEESNIGMEKNSRIWSDDYMAAQTFIFFVGGFETASGLLSHLFYQIALNPDIQKRLHEEVDNFRNHSGGKFEYNDIHKLKYLDMCVSETLRMYPPFGFLDRIACKDYVLPPPSKDSNKPYHMKANELIWIPLFAIHHDPKIYPNPKKFDPERFSEANQAIISPYTYLPFGIGPRSCIGSRYALMVVKSAIFQMLTNFEFVVIKKTPIPLVFENEPFTLHVKGGVWIGLKKRRN